jgi:peptidoglycan/xylan/chitin deacetylase (PgdA/CDA1 family)
VKHLLRAAAAGLAGFLVSSGAPGGQAAHAAQPSVTLAVSPLAFSPDADGIKDTLRATIRVTEPVSLTIDIADEHGTLVYTNAPGVSVAAAGPVRFRWNGRMGPDERGELAHDGRYLIRVTATNSLGAQAVAEQRVLLDTTPPLMRWGRGGVAPTILRKGSLSLRFRLYDVSDRVHLKIELRDQAGDPVPAGSAQAAAPGRVALRWPRAHAARLTPGAYGLALKGLDEAGNTSTSARESFLVDHPVQARVYALFHGVGRRVALTFDDCNSGRAWASLLRTLARFKVKATFFCPGQQVLANPALARRTVRAGHAIGSHGWDHANFGALSFSSAERRLIDDRAVWWRLARVAPMPYFRPPYGAYDSTTMAAAGRAGYGAVVLWDVDPRDWTRPGSAAIISRVLAHAHAGSIILMHVLDQTAAALPSIIRGLRRRHLDPVTLPVLDRIGTPSSGGWPPYRASASGA